MKPTRRIREATAYVVGFAFWMRTQPTADPALVPPQRHQNQAADNFRMKFGVVITIRKTTQKPENRIFTTPGRLTDQMNMS